MHALFPAMGQADVTSSSWLIYSSSYIPQTLILKLGWEDSKLICLNASQRN